MKYFSCQDGSIYSSKINFVDENNVLVGYDFSSNCCESFGWYVASLVTSNPDHYLFGDGNTNESINESIKDYTFDPTFFREWNEGDGEYSDEDNHVAFRLVNGDKEMFLHLYNNHNGYYSHGFDFAKDGEIIHSGCL